MHPVRYFILIEVLALVVIALVAFDLIILGIGSVNFNEIVTDWRYGFVLGLLCSISEPLVSGMVIRQVRPTELSNSNSPGQGANR
jgi:hypothetical protein